MVNKTCRAEFPNKCRYHGLDAQKAEIQTKIDTAINKQDFNGYYEHRLELDNLPTQDKAEKLEEEIKTAKNSQDFEKYKSLRDKLYKYVGVTYGKEAEEQSTGEAPTLVHHAVPLSNSQAANDPNNRPDHVIVSNLYGESEVYTAAEIYPDFPYSMRISANRPLTDSETEKIANLTGYLYRSTLNGEPLGNPWRDSNSSFVISADFTKASGKNNQSNFENDLNDFITNGTPIRKTNRSGPNTINTRLVDGINEDLDIKLYYA